jgi:hypothetical protein
VRTFLPAVVLALLAVDCAMADFLALVTRIEDDKVIFQKAPSPKDKKLGPSETLPLAKGARFAKARFVAKTKSFEAADPLDPAAVKEMMRKAPHGVFASLVTDSDGKAVTEIRFIPLAAKKDPMK